MTYQITTTQEAARLAILMEMLSYRRPAFSWSEELFIDKFILPHQPHKDEYGNLWLQVGDNPNILWSSHTDTVHHSPGYQFVYVDGDLVKVAHKDKEWGKTNCLGADDTAGVWLMLEMYKAQVPGVYVFHRNEENGGLGSAWVADNTPGMLEGIEFAVALDRKGKTSVITHQHGRCCSDEFATSLAEALGMGFKLDDTGIFTDTANYTDLIGECTNLSVGYEMAHGPKESLDYRFLMKLRDTLCTADFTKLVSKRKPGEEDEDAYFFAGRYKAWKGWEDAFPDWDKPPKVIKRHHTSELEEYVYNNPSVVADFLEQCGYTVRDLEDFNDEAFGLIR